MSYQICLFLLLVCHYWNHYVSAVTSSNTTIPPTLTPSPTDTRSSTNSSSELTSTLVPIVALFMLLITVMVTVLCIIYYRKHSNKNLIREFFVYLYSCISDIPITTEQIADFQDVPDHINIHENQVQELNPHPESNHEQTTASNGNLSTFIHGKNKTTGSTGRQSSTSKPLNEVDTEEWCLESVSSSSSCQHYMSPDQLPKGLSLINEDSIQITEEEEKDSTRGDRVIMVQPRGTGDHSDGSCVGSSLDCESKHSLSVEVAKWRQGSDEGSANTTSSESSLENKPRQGVMKHSIPIPIPVQRQSLLVPISKRVQALLEVGSDRMIMVTPMGDGGLVQNHHNDISTDPSPAKEPKLMQKGYQSKKRLSFGNPLEGLEVEKGSHLMMMPKDSFIEHDHTDSSEDAKSESSSGHETNEEFKVIYIKSLKTTRDTFESETSPEPKPEAAHVMPKKTDDTTDPQPQPQPKPKTKMATRPPGSQKSSSHPDVMK